MCLYPSSAGGASTFDLSEAEAKKRRWRAVSCTLRKERCRQRSAVRLQRGAVVLSSQRGGRRAGRRAREARGAKPPRSLCWESPRPAQNGLSVTCSHRVSRW